MSFEYIICLDFEATCWENSALSCEFVQNKENSEIIEFAAVLLSSKSGKIEDQFHCYVRPTLFPKLSDYCVNLTGITQDLVDRQETYPIIHRRFLDWIEKLHREKGLRFATVTERKISQGPNAAFCSWSSWDLRFFLRIECERNNLDCPPYLKTWIDVRKMYDRKYPFGKCTFTEALKRANIYAVGNAHSGISDATNLVKLVMHLVNKKIKFNRTTDYYY